MLVTSPIAPELDQSADTPDLGEVTPVLHDGMDPACLLRTPNEIAGLLQCFGHRLFGEDMASGFQSGRNGSVPRGWHHDIEKHIWAGFGQDPCKIVTDEGGGQSKFRGPRFCTCGVQVDNADNLDITNGADCFEPGFAHGSAAD